MDLFSTCLYCSNPPFNHGLLCEACIDRDYAFLRNTFVGDILDLLPQGWVRESAVAFVEFDLENLIDIAYHFTPKENINSIMEICIINSYSDYPGDSPYNILNMLRYKGAKFNEELYRLTRSDKCIDSERILALFCDLPVTKIQRAWLRYRKWKRNRAVQIIQPKIIEWLYKPGGPMMKKSEKSFNQLIMSQSRV